MVQGRLQLIHTLTFTFSIKSLLLFHVVNYNLYFICTRNNNLTGYFYLKSEWCFNKIKMNEIFSLDIDWFWIQLWQIGHMGFVPFVFSYLPISSAVSFNECQFCPNSEIPIGNWMCWRMDGIEYVAVDCFRSCEVLSLKIALCIR